MNSKETSPSNAVPSSSRPELARHLLAANSHADSITYAGQSALPRLPIPSLEETLEKFPKIVAPLQDEKQQVETLCCVQEFLQGDGPILQNALKEYEAKGFQAGVLGSYVEEFWNEAYLSPDASVVLNLNPFFVLEDGPDPKTSKDQLRRAASFCFAAVRLACMLKDESLSPDTFRGTPLCMDQFKVLFGASRQPAVHDDDNKCDDVHVYRDSSHVAVLCNNQFYYFPALHPSTGHVAVDESDILDILEAIQKHATEMDPIEASHSALGVLTSLPRSEWAVARQELCKSEVNKAALHVIDSALFVLVLDDATPTSIHETAANMLHGTNQLLTGDTQVGSCINRWYDKLQLIVCKDGTCGCNFEHSSIDGHTALRFVSDCFAETVISFAESIVDLIHGRGTLQHVIEAKVQRAANMLDEQGRPILDVFPKKLRFDLSSSTLSRIAYAESALSDEIAACDTFVLEFRDYGKLLIVGNKLSPDSFVQMSILLAYYKLYGKVVCMYEPVLTKAFYHGRTEAMRTVTPAAKKLCEIWVDPLSTPADKLEALRVATKEHSRLVKECAKGKGVDRHLYSLMCIANRIGIPTPAFFQSEALKTLNHTVLSTSNCGNPSLRLFGFGPVVPDGFGVGYIIKDSGLSYSVSSKHRQTQRYVRCMQSTLKEMQLLLKPLSTVEVTQRHTLRDIKQPAATKQHTSFADIWGESEDVAPEKPPNRALRELSSSYFAKVKPRGRSVDLLSVPDIHIDINLNSNKPT